MPTVLLLGATGFLGRHVHDRFRELATARVVTAARSGGGADVRLDLADAAAVAAAVGAVAPDIVVNCAGLTVGGPAELALGNVVGPANLIEALLAADRPVRLVHLGSAAEYGPVPAGTAVDEDSPERPVGVYGVTKLAGTRLVRAAAAAGLDALALRVANPVGPGSPPSTVAGRLVEQLHRVAAVGGEITTGPLDDVRDFVDVRDVAAATVAAALHPARSDRAVLNVGSGRPTRVATLVHRLLAVAGCDAPLRIETGGSARSSAVPWQQCDSTAIGTAIGWRPTRDLDVSLRDLWYAAAGVR